MLFLRRRSLDVDSSIATRLSTCKRLANFGRGFLGMFFYRRAIRKFRLSGGRTKRAACIPQKKIDNGESWEDRRVGFDPRLDSE